MGTDPRAELDELNCNISQAIEAWDITDERTDVTVGADLHDAAQRLTQLLNTLAQQPSQPERYRTELHDTARNLRSACESYVRLGHDTDALIDLVEWLNSAVNVASPRTVIEIMSGTRGTDAACTAQERDALAAHVREHGAADFLSVGIEVRFPDIHAAAIDQAQRASDLDE